MMLTEPQYSDLPMAVPTLCGSGWGRQRRNAKLGDGWSNTHNFLPSKLGLKITDH